jgi:AraC-like DNA-binding protein
MHYFEAAPDPRLIPFVKCYWGLRISGAPPEEQRVLPDGCCELVLHLGDRFTQRSNGKLLAQPRNLFVGPSAKAIVISPGEQVDALAIRFRPGGAALLLRAPLAELRDLALSCEEIGVHFGCDVRDRLTPLTDTERIAFLDRLLLHSLSRYRPDPLVLRIQHTITATGGAVRIGELAGREGLSMRHLQRRFQATVGLSPKTLARLVRLQRALVAAQREDATLARVAAEAGYADQPHFNREFQEIAGIAPTEFFRGVHSLNDLFFTDPGID